MSYRKRILESLLSRHLSALGGVLIQGPRACGKTTTARRISRSERLFALDSVRRDADAWLILRPELLFEGDAPMLLDEWQRFPAVWDTARREIDRRSHPGQFLLTASAKLSDPRKIFHSGAGRISRLRMRPMTLWESGESNGTVSLRALFEGEREVAAVSDLSSEDLAFALCRGGWPMAVGLPREAALEQAFDYYNAVTKEDITRVDGVKRTSERVERLMRSLARHQGSQAPLSTLRADLLSNETATLDEDTISSYIDSLKKIFVVEDLPAWNPNLRSKTAIRTTDTRYFVDPSIATAALGLGPADLMKDLNTTGFLFETLCIRDLRVFAEALNGKVYHYRDKNGLECDAVVHLRDGRYALIEIKLGGPSLIDEGAKTLQQLTQRIDTARMNEPAFRMVLTATGQYAYRRPEDGIYVVPIGCLGA